jgi:hypothetical protein
MKDMVSSPFSSEGTADKAEPPGIAPTRQIIHNPD